MKKEGKIIKAPMPEEVKGERMSREDELIRNVRRLEEARVKVKQEIARERAEARREVMKREEAREKEEGKKLLKEVGAVGRRGGKVGMFIKMYLKLKGACSKEEALRRVCSKLELPLSVGKEILGTDKFLNAETEWMLGFIDGEEGEERMKILMKQAILNEKTSDGARNALFDKILAFGGEETHWDLGDKIRNIKKEEVEEKGKRGGNANDRFIPRDVAVAE